MDKDVVDKFKLAGVIVGVIGLFIIGALIYKALTFHVVRTNPSSGSVTVVSPFFNVEFNRDISNKVNVSSSPTAISSYAINKKTLDITLAIPLNPATTYKIYISNIYDTGGHKLGNQVYVFKPKVDNGTLPADQNSALLNKQQQYNENVLNNGLVKLLPFTGPNFEYQIGYTVNYVNNNYKLTFQITAQTPQAQQDALAWIQSVGFNPSSLNIQYINQAP